MMFKVWNRPLSPHLTIYVNQLTSVYSIWHRLTGIFLIFLLVTFLLLYKTFSYVVFNDYYFNFFSGVYLWIKNCIFLNCIFLFVYHTLNGLRHISWDLGFNLSVSKLITTAKLNAFFLVILVIFFLKNIIT